MSIQDTYIEFILEQIIQEILLEGSNPSASEIASRFEAFTDTNELTEPLFIASNYHVAIGKNSSSSDFNQMNSDIQRDFKVMYRHLFKVSDQAVLNFDRWRSETQILEGRLDTLQERINSLLLLSADTAGYFDFLQDNFTDNSKIDLTNTTAYVNVDKGNVSIGTSAAGATRVDLSSLRNSDIGFTVLSRNNLVSTITSVGSKKKYVVSDVTNFWQERVYTNKPGPITVELKIDLLDTETISRIDIDLHMANQNSSVQVTPMYSTDNYNWKQLPITTFSRSIIDKSTFQFTEIDARWVKLIMTKVGYDQVHNELYAYEFGVDEVSFYTEGFTSNTDATVISKALSVLDEDGNVQEFSRIVLEVCEDVPDNTSIDYFVSTFNDPDSSLGTFVPIDPISREITVSPTVLDFGDLSDITVSGINTSYDSTAVSGLYINPAQSFISVDSTSGTTAVTSSGLSSGPRYSFTNSNERILDYCITSGVLMAKGTMELWRNVSLKGLDTKVRGYVNGWGFNDPYYKTTVEVDNAIGYSVDFGDKVAVVDGESKAGKITLAKGIHSIKVHKNNWKAIAYSSVTDLETLKDIDTLYPYNHRYLVEGYPYATDWSTTEEEIYRGFDTVAEFLLKEVGVFDMLNNVESNDYSRFAKDHDVEDTARKEDGSAASYTDPNTVFLIKTDEGNPDFVNEEFVLRFKSANSLFKYLRFKAVLRTEDENITPFLDTFRIKISS